MRHTRTATVALTVICLFISITTPLYSEETIFTPLKIDGPIHDPANHTYWFGPFCECASILDVDGDGDLDLLNNNDGSVNTLWLNDGSGYYANSGR